MFLYITSTGEYARTQAEAGKGATKVDVPTDARGLVAYLNGLTRPEDPGSPVEARQELPAPPAPLILRDPSGQQPDQRLEPSRSRGAFKLRAGDEADQFSEWVMEAPSFAVHSVFGACIERFNRMASSLVG